MDQLVKRVTAVGDELLQDFRAGRQGSGSCTPSFAAPPTCDPGRSKRMVDRYGAMPL